PPAPAIRDVVADQVAGVDPRVHFERGVPLARLREHLVVRPGHVDVLEPLAERLHRAEDSTAPYANLAVAPETVEGLDIVVHDPVPLVTTLDRVLPGEVSRRSRALALRQAQLVARIVVLLVLRIQ